MINAANINALADLLFALPPQKFDYGSFVGLGESEPDLSD